MTATPRDDRDHGASDRRPQDEDGRGRPEQGTWLVSNEGSPSPGIVSVQLNMYHAQGGDGGQPAFSVTTTMLSMITSAAAAGGPHVYVAIP